MYKLVEQIENINNVYTSEDNYIFVDKNENVYLNDVKSVQYKSIYFVLNGHLLKQNTENESFLYLNETLVKKINHSYIYNTYSEDGCFYYENLHYDPVDDKLKKNIYYHNFKDDSIKLFIKDFSGNFQLIFENNTFFIQPNNTLTSLSLLTGDYEWENNLSKYGEIRKILGLVNEKLWVVLYETETRKKQLVSLHTATGKIIDIIDATLPLHDWHIALLEETQTIVSIYGKISTHQKADSPFVEICAITGAVLRNERIESLFQANLKLGQWCYSNHKIYFTAATDTINSTHIGVLDYTTLNLEWFTEVKDRKAGIKDLQVTENKIYALDQGGQLFIFEKEKVVNLKESSE